MIQKFDIKEIPVVINGFGRIDDTQPIDLLEYAIPMDNTVMRSRFVRIIPSKISVSKEIAGTVYDITADFDAESKQTLLQQFQKMILNSQNC